VSALYWDVTQQRLSPLYNQAELYGPSFTARLFSINWIESRNGTKSVVNDTPVDPILDRRAYSFELQVDGVQTRVTLHSGVSGLANWGWREMPILWRLRPVRQRKL
jgi:hypothetical protein